MTDMGTHAWKEIKDKFGHTLLLGNGSSIAISSAFKYDSLLGKAIELGFLDEETKKLFNHFNTKDFEYVLRMLMIANKVNEVVDIESPKIAGLYGKIRHALIEVVRVTHISHDDALPHLHPIARFISGFDTILSLNYDLILYWAFMWSNSNLPDDAPAYFKDCMRFYGQEYNGELAENWRDYREHWEGHPPKKPALVFYPHGNLGLVAPLFGRDRKIAVDKNFPVGDLLSRVYDVWQGGEVSPLFVSEGESAQKELAIRRSDYLSTVFESVTREEVEKSVLMYGFGMKDSDDHITRALLHRGVDRLGFALHKGSPKTKARVLSKVLEIEKEQNRKLEVWFFDSKSDGAWIYPVEPNVNADIA